MPDGIGTDGSRRGGVHLWRSPSPASPVAHDGAMGLRPIDGCDRSRGPLRIAYVTEVWNPTINGVVTRLTGTIGELRRRGHEVLVVAPAVEGAGGVPAPAGRDEGLTVRTVPAAGVPFVYGGQRWGLPLPCVGRYLDEFEPDVVHVVNPALLGIAGVAAARRRRTPLVCSYHTDIAAYASYYHLGWMRPAIWWLLRSLHRRATVNLVTSAAALEQLRRAGVPRIRMWRRGVDLDRFRPDEHRAAPSGAQVALYVGRLAEEKGLARLAELREIEDLRLVVVGEGPARNTLVNQLGTEGVELTGRLDGEDLAGAYRCADVFVFPSVTETLGLVLLEALACGLPVVAADSPASREVLGGCGAARLVRVERPGALAAGVSDLLACGRRRDMAAEARAWVDGCGWSMATTQLIDHYRAAVEAHAWPSPDIELAA